MSQIGAGCDGAETAKLKEKAKEQAIRTRTEGEMVGWRGEVGLKLPRMHAVVGWLKWVAQVVDAVLHEPRHRRAGSGGRRMALAH